MLYVTEKGKEAASKLDPTDFSNRSVEEYIIWNVNNHQGRLTSDSTLFNYGSKPFASELHRLTIDYLIEEGFLEDR